MLPPRQDWVNKIMKKKIILWKEQLVVPKSMFYYPWCSQVTPTNFPTPTNCKPGYIETNDLGLEYKPWTHEWVNVARYAIRCRGLFHVKVWLRHVLYMFITRTVTRVCPVWNWGVIFWGGVPIGLKCLAHYRFAVFPACGGTIITALRSKLIFAYFEYISLQKITDIT